MCDCIPVVSLRLEEAAPLLDCGFLKISKRNTKSVRAFKFDGHDVRWSSVHKYVGDLGDTKCALCGAPAHHVEISKQKELDGRWIHYAHIMVMKNNKPARLNRDHIFPKSFGGTLHHDNIRLTCWVCNTQRDRKMTLHDLVHVARHFDTTATLVKLLDDTGKKSRLTLCNPQKLLRQLASRKCVVVFPPRLVDNSSIHS